MDEKMPLENKRLIDYVIDHTNQRFDKHDEKFDKIEVKLDQLLKFKWQALGVIVIAGFFVKEVLEILVKKFF